MHLEQATGESCLSGYTTCVKVEPVRKGGCPRPHHRNVKPRDVVNNISSVAGPSSLFLVKADFPVDDSWDIM